MTAPVITQPYRNETLASFANQRRGDAIALLKAAKRLACKQGRDERRLAAPLVRPGSKPSEQ